MLVTLYLMVQGYFLYTLLKPSEETKQPKQTKLDHKQPMLESKPINIETASFKYEAKTHA